MEAVTPTMLFVIFSFFFYRTLWSSKNQYSLLRGYFQNSKANDKNQWLQKMQTKSKALHSWHVSGPALQSLAFFRPSVQRLSVQTVYP